MNLVDYLAYLPTRRKWTIAFVPRVYERIVCYRNFVPRSTWAWNALLLLIRQSFFIYFKNIWSKEMVWLVVDSMLIRNSWLTWQRDWLLQHNRCSDYNINLTFSVMSSHVYITLLLFNTFLCSWFPALLSDDMRRVRLEKVVSRVQFADVFKRDPVNSFPSVGSLQESQNKGNNAYIVQVFSF